MNSNMYRDVVELNREGIQKFKEGRLGAALNSFSQALAMCDRVQKSVCQKKRYRREKRLKQKNSRNAKKSSTCISVGTSEVGQIKTSECSDIEEIHVSAASSSIARDSVFESLSDGKSNLKVALCSPIIFIDQDESLFDGNDDQVMQEEQSLVLGMTSMFNIVLTSHIMLLRDRSSGEKCKQTFALRTKTLMELYECAYLMLMKVEKKKRRRKSPLFLTWSRMLMFSILHGMGSISREFRMQCEWRDCFDCIFSLYVCLADQGINESDFPTYFDLDTIIYDVFGTLGVLSDSVYAPAA